MIAKRQITYLIFNSVKYKGALEGRGRPPASEEDWGGVKLFFHVASHECTAIDLITNMGQG